jgi:hypothetical protein
LSLKTCDKKITGIREIIPNLWSMPADPGGGSINTPSYRKSSGTMHPIEKVWVFRACESLLEDGNILHEFQAVSQSPLIQFSVRSRVLIKLKATRGKHHKIIRSL